MSMTSDILVVSADAAVLSGRVTALRRSGFSARACASFPDARRTLEDGPPPEVLVTDVRLGPYNGLHLVAVARVEFPRTVAIVIGGLTFMFGEMGAKRQIAGIVFGGGLALFAAQFLVWLF